SSRRRHTRSKRDWSSDVCSSDLSCFLLKFTEQLDSLLFSTVQSHLRFVDCKNDIHSTVFIYPTILGRQAHAVKQNAIQHLGIGRNIPEPLVREQHLRNSIECE